MLIEERTLLGDKLHRLVEELYPICRSITGDGVRETLRIIQKVIPLKINEVSTGTPVLDWTVPQEWNIRDAYIKDGKGKKIVDFKKCNLHVVSYSRPVKKKVPLDELKKHVFTLPEQPEWVPYRTSYYKDDWGFCLSHQQLSELKEGEYEVFIDSDLKDGSLTYGEYHIQGKTNDEILVSCHVCHPSLCDDNLSGISVAAHLAQSLSGASSRYSYRFLFVPGTIGSITWLALNEPRAASIKHGFVLTCVGDENLPTYKKSRQDDAEIDRAFAHVLKHSETGGQVIDFFPYGYDERQYCSPGFDLAVGCFMRGQHGQFPEYHSSADDLQFVKREVLADSFQKCSSVIRLLENNRTYLNQSPKGEPRLGKRGLYQDIGGVDRKMSEMALLWVLNLSDGKHTLLDIAVRAGLKFDLVQKAAEALLGAGLLKEAS